ncbi:MAG: hypothetical protein UT37_C0008G0013 [Parcubacteria group bacterium GW2011_GWA2_39_18]|nr:MAG: hypothetical protein UT37_C0008G0013 [Parcubacteria group bacterium GW2011_GWA2_39_18]
MIQARYHKIYLQILHMKHAKIHNLKKIFFIVLALYALSNFIALNARAYNLIISEIMYDLKDGSDTDREWVEIFNNGNETVDISGWKFYEGGTNHGINLVNEVNNFIIPVGDYALLVDNATKFLADWPNFSGIIFDSSFSLSNTGENITLRNAELEDVNSMSYSSGWGGNGDGNSLAKIVLSGVNNSYNWQGNSPTPGQENIFVSPSPSPEPSPTPSISASPSPSPSVSTSPSLATPSPSTSVSVTPSPSPSLSVYPTPSPSFMPSPTHSPSLQAVASPTPQTTPSPSLIYPHYIYPSFLPTNKPLLSQGVISSPETSGNESLLSARGLKSASSSSTNLGALQNKYLNKLKKVFSSNKFFQDFPSLSPKTMFWGFVVAGVSAAAVFFLFLKI